jgi:hemoglobin-like flavoprotein
MDVALLRRSFEALAPRADELARAFYERLLGTFPQVRPLFAATDFDSQRVKLMQSVAAVVALVDRPDELTPVLEQLGRSHQGYGVRPEMYGYVSFSLLATLADFAGEAWTEEVARTWEAALSAVGAAMIAAQEAAAA